MTPFTVDRTQARDEHEWIGLQLEAFARVYDALRDRQNIKAFRGPDGRWTTRDLRLQQALRYVEEIRAPEDGG